MSWLIPQSDFDKWLVDFEKNYKEPEASQIRRVRFLAENVHDFAWVASPNFLYEYDRWNDIDVHFSITKLMRMTGTMLLGKDP